MLLLPPGSRRHLLFHLSPIAAPPRLPFLHHPRDHTQPSTTRGSRSGVSMESRDDRIFVVRLKKQERPVVGGPESRRTRRHGQGAAVVALISVGWSCREDGRGPTTCGRSRPDLVRHGDASDAREPGDAASQAARPRVWSSKLWRIWGMDGLRAASHGSPGKLSTYIAVESCILTWRVFT